MDLPFLRFLMMRLDRFLPIDKTRQPGHGPNTLCGLPVLELTQRAPGLDHLLWVVSRRTPTLPLPREPICALERKFANPVLPVLASPLPRNTSGIERRLSLHEAPNLVLRPFTGARRMRRRGLVSPPVGGMR